MKTLTLLFCLLSGALVFAARADGMPRAATATVDCSAAFGHAASCVVVPCGALYGSFLGTWSGEFHAYDRQKSIPGKDVYRPYRNSVAYTEADCLKDPQTGDTFIEGHQTDDYPAFQDLPAKVAHGLLISGRHTDGTPFLRAVGEHDHYDYVLVYRNTAAKLAVWRLSVPASGGNPAMTFTTIDGRDFGATAGETRDVTVTLTVGPTDTPYWEGVIAYGSHTRH
jgi:hypothetical protein